jgi:hypothetical protein
VEADSGIEKLGDGEGKSVEKINSALIEGLFNIVHNHASRIMMACLSMSRLDEPVLDANRVRASN